MKKAAIIYASTHHGNTKKLVDAICRIYPVTKIDATVQSQADLSQYDLIGFASGIDFGKFYGPVEQFLKDNLPERKQVFFLYTCAMLRDGFTKTIQEAAMQKNALCLEKYGCRGFNTYGPWKLIGGMNKGHPNKEEIEGAVAFFEALADIQR